MTGPLVGVTALQLASGTVVLPGQSVTWGSSRTAPATSPIQSSAGLTFAGTAPTSSKAGRDLPWRPFAPADQLTSQGEPADVLNRNLAPYRRPEDRARRSARPRHDSDRMAARLDRGRRARGPRWW